MFRHVVSCLFLQMVEGNLMIRLRVTGEETMVVVVVDFLQTEWMIREIIGVSKEGGCFLNTQSFRYLSQDFLKKN